MYKSYYQIVKAHETTVIYPRPDLYFVNHICLREVVISKDQISSSFFVFSRFSFHWRTNFYWRILTLQGAPWTTSCGGGCLVRDEEKGKNLSHTDRFQICYKLLNSLTFVMGDLKGLLNQRIYFTWSLAPNLWWCIDLKIPKKVIF